MKASAQEDPAGKQKFPKEGATKFPNVAQGAVALLNHGMPVNMNTFQAFIAAFVAFALGAQNGNLVTVLMEGAGFLPNAGVEGNREVFDNDQDLFFHSWSTVLQSDW